MPLDVERVGDVVFVTGFLGGDVLLGTRALTSLGVQDAMLAGYDATSGELLFVRQWGVTVEGSSARRRFPRARRGVPGLGGLVALE